MQRALSRYMVPSVAAGAATALIAAMRMSPLPGAFPPPLALAVGALIALTLVVGGHWVAAAGRESEGGLRTLVAWSALTTAAGVVLLVAAGAGDLPASVVRPASAVGQAGLATMAVALAPLPACVGLDFRRSERWYVASVGAVGATWAAWFALGATAALEAVRA